MALRKKVDDEPVELSPADEVQAAELAVLSVLQQLQLERTRIEAARERYRQELHRPAPADPFGIVFVMVDKMQMSLRSSRPDLLGLPPGPSKARALVDDCELQLQRAEGLFVKRQEQLGQYRNTQGDNFQDVLRMIETDSRNVRLCRSRLHSALLALGDEMTQADRRRVLELADAPDPVIAVSA